MQKLATLVSLAVLAAGGADLKMQNIAHRGMWDKEVPQNTVEAIKRAYDSGATWVETDFHHTKAGQMVCMHAEGELRKYTGCTKKVKDLTPEDIATLRATLKEVYCDEKVGDYILDIVFATREPDKTQGLESLKEQIQVGASPRATLSINLAARANALMHGRAYATPQDVKEIAHDVLRHRILLTYEAEAENVTSDMVIDKILSTIPVP